MPGIGIRFIFSRANYNKTLLGCRRLSDRRGFPPPLPGRRRADDVMSQLAIDLDGLANRARQVPSPNCDARPADTLVTLAVVHGISLPPGHFGGEAIEKLFTNRLDPQAHPYFRTIAALRVSAHFLIRRDGELVQFVACNARAWHAGASCWGAREGCNDFSVGIELEGCDDVAYDPRQYGTLGEILQALARRYPVNEVVGHSDIAPERKTDPGPAFEWRRLARELAKRRVALRLPALGL